MDKINIEIEGLSATIEQTDSQSASRTSKVVSVEDLMKSFQSGHTKYSSPFLPGEYGVHKIITKGKNEYYLYSEPAKEISIDYDLNYYLQDIYFENEENDDDDETSKYLLSEHIQSEFSVDIPTYQDEEEEEKSEDYHITLNTASPVLLWMIHAVREEGSLYFQRTKLYSLKNPVLTGKEPLYHAPFGNIYDEAGVCWGGVTLRTPDVRSIQGLSTLFFNSEFNRDLSGGRVGTKEYFSSQTRDSLPMHLILHRMREDSKSFEEVQEELTGNLRMYSNETVLDEFLNFSGGD